MFFCKGVLKRHNCKISKDINQATFLEYDKLESFDRPLDMNIIDFINEFERLYKNINKYDMEFPTGVLAYRLLEIVGISKDKQLAIATLRSLTHE